MEFALRQTQGFLRDHFHAQAVFHIASPDLIVSASPALTALANAVRGLLVDAALLGLVALLAWQFAAPGKRTRRFAIAAALLALCATLPSEVRTPGEFCLHYALSLATAAAGVAFCYFFARRNYMAYAVVLWVMALHTPMSQLFATGNPSLTAQAWLLAGIMAASVVWAFGPMVLKPRPSAGE